MMVNHLSCSMKINNCESLKQSYARNTQPYLFSLKQRVGESINADNGKEKSIAGLKIISQLPCPQFSCARIWHNWILFHTHLISARRVIHNVRIISNFLQKSIASTVNNCLISHIFLLHSVFPKEDGMILFEILKEDYLSLFEFPREDHLSSFRVPMEDCLSSFAVPSEDCFSSFWYLNRKIFWVCLRSQGRIVPVGS